MQLLVRGSLDSIHNIRKSKMKINGVFLFMGHLFSSCSNLLWGIRSLPVIPSCQIMGEISKTVSKGLPDYSCCTVVNSWGCYPNCRLCC